MCPDCKAVLEEMGVLKERLLDQQRHLVRFDAMLEEGKLVDLKPLPNNAGVYACSEVSATEMIPDAAIQRALMSEGRTAAQRLITHASERLRMAVLEELKPHVHFADSMQDPLTRNTRVMAYLLVATKR